MTRQLSLAALALAALTNGLAADAQAGNPIVRGSSSVSRSYDPFTDTHYVQTERKIVRESAHDWNRNHIDPGSYREVDRIVVDDQGYRVREYGVVWTSYGKLHGKLKRVRVTYEPARPTYLDTPVYQNPPRRPGRGGTIHQHGGTVVFTPNPNAGGRRGGVVNQNGTTVDFSPVTPGGNGQPRGGVVNQQGTTVRFAPQFKGNGGTIHRDFGEAIFNRVQ